MMHYFYEGGMPGMITTTIFGLGAIASAVMALLSLIKSKPVSKFHLNSISVLGSISLFTGLLWQAIGVYQILAVIQEMGEISKPVLAAGIKMTMITPIWGAILFSISIISWLVIKLKTVKA